MIRLLLLLSICVGLMGQISSIPGATPGGGSGAPNVTASSTVAVTSLPMNISSLNLSSLDTLLVQCWSGASAPLSPVTITSINPASTTNITINFASTANVVCRANSNGGAGPQGVPGATGPAGANGTNGTNGAISRLQDEGVDLPVQPTIDFVGAGVSVTNGSGKSVVNIPGGPGGGNYQTVQSAGVAQPAQPTLNILASAGGVTACVDDIANNRTNCSFGADTSIVLTQATAQAGTPWLCTGTGTAGAQTCNMTPALGAYTSGQVIQYRPGTTNTTTQTVSINGLTAISILRHDGTALQAGDLTSGRQYPITYDGTAFRLPPAGAGGAAVTAIPPYLQVGAVRYLAPTMYEVARPSDLTFSWVNQGTASVVSGANGDATLVAVSGGTGINWRTRAASMGANLTAEFAHTCVGGSLSGVNVRCGVGLRESATGRMMIWFIQISNSGAATTECGCFTDTSWLVINPFDSRPMHQVGATRFIRFVRSGGNILGSYSADGVVWQQGFSVTTTPCFTTAPDQVIVSSNYDGTTGSPLINQLLSVKLLP